MPVTMTRTRPRIGITPDLYDRDGVETARCSMAYADMVVKAGGEPVFLCPAATPDVSIVDGVVLTGGDDPVMEPFGVETSEHAVRVLSVARRSRRGSSAIWRRTPGSRSWASVSGCR